MREKSLYPLAMSLSRLSFATLAFLAAGQSEGQTAAAQPPTLVRSPSATRAVASGTADEEQFSRLSQHTLFRYTQQQMPPMSFMDQPGSALRVVDGTIRLSLQDAIALAIENNLDVASVGLLRPAALTDVQRSKSGLFLRNIPTGVFLGPPSASGPLTGASAFGYEGVANGSTGTSLSVQLIGAAIPNTEPTLFASARTGHGSLPVVNPVLTGTNFLDTKETDFTVGFRKGYFTGTVLTAQFDSFRIDQNAPNNSINPAFSGDASLRIDQHLLQGAGRRTNMRAVYVARNNTKIADIIFHQQLTLTVSQVCNLYYDLVAFRDQLAVVQTIVDRANGTLGEDRRRLDLGLGSTADVIRSQLELERDQQALLDARAQIADQEYTLKSVLTRSGLADPAVISAQIVPTDQFLPLTADQITSDPATASARAAARRPELLAGSLSEENRRLSLLGTRSALKPTLDAYLSLQNNALAGRLNRNAPPGIVNGTSPAILGGAGTMFDQLVHRNYPDYQVGIQLNLPVLNRAAQADAARNQIDLRQQEIALQTATNNIRLQALKATTGLNEARSQWEASTRTRKLQQQSVAEEQKMFEFGTSDPVRIATAQHDLEVSQVREITALNTYARAQVNLQAVLDQTLEDNHVIVQQPNAR
jgi:outer membrane protein